MKRRPLISLALCICVAVLCLGTTSYTVFLHPAEQPAARIAQLAATAVGGALFAWALARLRRVRDQLPLDDLIAMLERVGRGDFSRPSLAAESTTGAALNSALTKMVDGLTQRDADRITHEITAVESEARYRAFAELGSDFLWETDAKGRITYFSGAFDGLGQVDAQAVIGRPLAALMPFGAPGRDGSPPANRRAINNLKGQYKDSAGQDRVFRLDAQAIHDGSGAFRGYVGVGNYVTEDISESATISPMAYRDPLTGLANAAFAKERAAQALTGCNSARVHVAVLHVDLDHFSAITDAHGQAFGDDLLRSVAERLAAAVGAEDTLARMIGNAFVIVHVAHRGQNTTEQLCQGLLHAMQQPFRVRDITVTQTASIGGAVTDANGDAADLFRDAEIAMYRAKDSGRDQVRFHDTVLDTTWVHRQSMQRALKKAISTAALEVLFQPQIDAETGVVTAFQAHQRWPRKDHGMVHPADYLPVAEEAGLLSDLIAPLLLTACKTTAGWPEQRISVAVPTGLLMSEDLVPTVARSLRDAALPGHRLELLVPQEAFAAGTEAHAFQIDALLELGVKVALDGVGIDVSPVGVLRSLPFDGVRLHARLVQGICSDAKQAGFVSALVQLARSLDLEVCADGIKHEDEAARLSAFGCNRLQGPLYGKAMSPLRCNSLLRTHGLLDEQPAVLNPL